MFSVVEFKDKEVEAVLSSWVCGKKCWLPKSSYLKHLNDHSTPNKVQWNFLCAVVLKSSGSQKNIFFGF